MRIGSDPERSNLRVRCANGYIPADLLLHITTLIEDVEVMRLLVTEYDADVNSATSDHYLWTPLHTAALNGRTKMITILITEFNADVNATGFQEWTPLHCAAYAGHADAIRELARSSQASTIPPPPRTHSIHARRHKDMVNREVIGGNMAGNYSNAALKVRVPIPLDVDATAFDAWTPLHLAVANGNTDAAQVLVNELRANINFKLMDHGIGTSYGATPLFVAKKMRKWDVVRFLEMNGAIGRSVSDWFYNETKFGRWLFALLFYEVPIYLVIGRINFPPPRGGSCRGLFITILVIILLFLILSWLF
jgi:ankyrin repeat protein